MRGARKDSRPSKVIHARDAVVWLPIVTAALLGLAWVGKQKEIPQPGAVLGLAIMIQIGVLALLAFALLSDLRTKLAKRE